MHKLAFLFLACLLLNAACMSASDGGCVRRIRQNREQGIPDWAYGTFTGRDAQIYLGGYSAGEGFYAAGSGSSEAAARLNAREHLAVYCGAKKHAAARLHGSRIVDTFAADDGTVYILMFISKKDARKSIRD